MTSAGKSLSIFTFLLLVCASAFIVSTASENDILEREFKHSAYLDIDQRVHFKWSVASSLPTAESANSDVLVAEISAPSLGYVGFGISPTGGMIGADILFMWVDNDNGLAYLQNRFATANAEPHILGDGSRKPPIILSYKGNQNATHTTFRFARFISASCTNAKNYDIESGATKIIFSYSPDDPTPPPKSHATYHGPKRRGTKTLYLLDDQTGAYERDKQAAARESNNELVFTANKFKVPPVETHYQQEFHQLPKFNADIQIVQFDAVIDPPANIRFVHHFMVWICDHDFVVPKIRSTNFSSYETESWSTASSYTASKCMFSTLWAWAVGGTAFAMPHNVGLRLTPRDSGRYVLVETHYNNPDRVKGVRDSSGVRISLLEAPRALRPRDASYFIVGFHYGPEQTIPSGVDEFKIPGVCTPECTSKFVPKNGVQIFGVLLHSHTAGKSIVLRHFRRSADDGKEVELPPIAADHFYDFNYQLWRPVNATLLPGDRLVVECTCATSKRRETTFGGQMTTEEMCYANMFTTPPIEMNACVSIIQRDSIFKALGETVVDDKEAAVEQRHYVTDVFAQKYVKGVRLYKDQVRHYNWTTTKIETLQKLYYSDQHTYMCGSSKNVTDFLEGHEKVFVDGTRSTEKSAKSCLNNIILDS